MNFIRKFIGTAPTDEIASVASGKFFLTRSPRSPKGSLECLYNDAFATIRQTTRTFIYQLSIAKVYQEGEIPDNDSGGFDSDDEYDEPDTSTSEVGGKTKDEWTFSIVEDLQFQFVDKADGSVAVAWVDVNGDAGDQFEFVIGVDVKRSEVAQFKAALLRCVYESKYHKSAQDVSLEELERVDETLDDVKNDILRYGAQ